MIYKIFLLLHENPLVTFFGYLRSHFDKWVCFTNVKVVLHIPNKSLGWYGSAGQGWPYRVFILKTKNTSCSLYAVVNMEGYETDDIS